MYVLAYPGHIRHAPSLGILCLAFHILERFFSPDIQIFSSLSHVFNEISTTNLFKIMVFPPNPVATIVP